ncbi:SusC/RagA family TonB-linked outer membrane protein [Pseudoflavitalea sp. G-6-1-2]|uniref:SusC/RagA family TonB-linked outer membrane protein n=1 Tax=Pseudoflavitalea sp. G-6-1-2 TaxID=2728841 RepID=UPI00146C48F4|nr:SusC/RagA family TonB-linked outer membrane protein [Pseudoflavitalea sp. G-6-1-2]NML22275.1 SusC/RagA family TonB-linked outer membrane protein [Pseudoflavitalea sp. G-6-1-2]
MKLTVLFLTVAFMNVSANSFSQNVSFSGSNVPLEKVFNECKKQTGYSFLYPSSLLSIAHPVTIYAENMPLEQFLKELFRTQPIGYEINNRSILLFAKPVVPAIINPAANQSIDATAPQVNAFPVKIKVIDSLGVPMPRASVMVKNKKISKVTNAEGIADLQVDFGDVIEISYVGYETVTYTVRSITSVVYINLKLSDKGMDEVVTGYTRLRKESFTGNSIRITQEDIQKVGNRNVISALQIFDPSFRMEVNNIMGSDPNTLPEFYIRGRSGIGVKSLDQVDVSQAALSNNPNLPIFILDGFEIPVERVYDYDITRIASVTILKDAAATAIYGSRAANGVVVIQTVAPVPGKLHVDYNMLTSLSMPDLTDYNLMNASEKLQAEELAGYYKPDGITNPAFLTQELLAKRNQINRGVNTDWIAQPLQNALNQKHSLVFEGGFDQLRFSAKLAYDVEKGVMKGSKRERKSAALQIDYRVKNFQVRNDFSYDVVDARDSPYGDFAAYTRKNPYDEAYDADGKPVKTTTRWRYMAEPLSLVNPLYEALMTQNFNTNGYHAITNNTGISWKPFSKLTVRGEIALGRTFKRSDKFIDPASGTQVGVDNIGREGKLNIGRTDEYSFNTNIYANYVNNIGGHNMNFSGGVNIKENKGTQVSEFYAGFPSGQLNSPNYASVMERKSAYVDNITRLFGTFLALNYTYRDIYLLDLSGRVDGSSSFGADKRFAPFWSAGSGINFHNYNFLKGNTVFNRVKLTGSFGQLGKTNFPPYAAKGTYIVQQAKYSTGAGVLLKAMENPNLTWEITNTIDVVLDLGLFRNKLNINLNWYDKVTRDLVNDVDMPLSSGFPTYNDNVGKIRNRGVELGMRYDVIRKKDFYFNVSLNFASNKNTLVELSNSLRRYNELVNQQYDGFNDALAVLQSPDIKKRYSTAHTKFVEGASVTSIYGMRSLGINPADGKEIYMRPDGTITYVWSAGDQVAIGDATPKAQGTFALNAVYKGFSLYVACMYQFGGLDYNYTLLSKVENVDLYSNNADRRVLSQRWQQAGDLTQLKDISDRLYLTRPTSRFIQRNNQVRLSTLTVAYDIPQKKVARFGLSRFKVQLTGSNLATISSIQQERGLQYPFARTFELSLKAAL